MTSNRSGWDELVSRHRLIWEQAPYELEFVDLVLRRVPNLSPSLVRPQTPFTAVSGARHRMDFGIAEEPFVHLALEVDGYDKTGRGAGMTHREFDDWLQRDTELRTQGWDVLRFSNRVFVANPLGAVRIIDLALRNSRAIARERERAAQSPASTISEGERQELAALREDLLAEARRLRSENDRMGRVSLAMGLVFAGALVAIAIVLSGRVESPRSAPTAPPASIPAQSRPPGTSPGTAPVAGACRSTHPIKGNINLQGEKIYHAPGGEFYNQTNPERCFATTADAEVEGFRRSAR